MRALRWQDQMPGFVLRALGTFGTEMAQKVAAFERYALCAERRTSRRGRRPLCQAGRLPEPQIRHRHAVQSPRTVDIRGKMKRRHRQMATDAPAHTVRRGIGY